ncbi:MAG: YCF48-related protein [Actinomycetota bacterium]|nr:YCF48-related protein [Actinomycetota bacterium]
MAHNSLPNYQAMVSGQAPTPDTQGDCTSGSEWAPPDPVIGAHGQAVGQGCIFPAKIKTLFDQLTAKGLMWKGYMEDLRNSTARDGVSCPTIHNTASYATDAYVRKHDPIQWFHSLFDDNASCMAHDQSLYALARDLQSVRTTPNFSFIAPNQVHDGHDASGASDWAAYADVFLRQYLPMITSSPAFRQDGLLIVTFDESETIVGVPSTAEDDMSCCNEIPGPNSPDPGVVGPGGGHVGAVALSPFIKPKSTDAPSPPSPTLTGVGYYNHYSFLRSMEDLFQVNKDTGLGGDNDGHLGFAGTYAPTYPGPGSFGADVYNAAPVGGVVASPVASGAGTGPRKADGSLTWQHPLPQGEDLKGVSCPSLSACVAVGNTGAIVTTGDGGAHWKWQDSATGADLRAVSCASTLACVAVGDAGVALRTSDGGAHWSSVQFETKALNAVSCPSTSTCFAAGDEGTLARSDDGGASWSAQDSKTNEPLYGIGCPAASTCFAAGRTGVIVATTNGATWSAQSSGTQERLHAIACWSVAECLVAGDSDKAFKTSNGGASWTQLFNTGTDNTYLGVACAGPACELVGKHDPSVGGFAPAGAEGASVTATNGGASFAAKDPGTRNPLSSVSCTSATTCVGVGDRGTIVRTSNGGATAWTSQMGAPDSDLSRVTCWSGHFCGFEGMSSLTGMSCTDANVCFAVGSYGTIMSTADGGAAWTTQKSGAPSPPPNKANAPPLSPPGLNSVSCPGGGNCVAVGDQGSAQATTDGGANWSDKSAGTPNDLLGVSCPAIQVCVAVGMGGTIARTSNGGANWSTQSAGPGITLSAISCPDTSTCVAVGNFGAVLRTTDGGAHWAAEDSGTTAYLAGVSCPLTNVCIAVGSGGTVLRITGSVVPSPKFSGVGDDLMSISCAGPTHCVATGSLGTLISTANGGNGWTVQGTGTSRALRATSCPSTDKCIAAGDAAAILGVTPTAKPGNPPEPGGGPPPGGLGDLGGLLNGVTCEVKALKSEILGRALRLTRRFVQISGRSRTHQCRQDRVTHVRVAIARVLRRGRCQFLGPNERLGRARLCSRPVYQLARVHYVASRLVTDWTFSRRVVLPPGSYRVQVRGQDRIGLLEPSAISRPALVSARSR